MKQVVLTFESDAVADIAIIVIEDALGGYVSPNNVVTGISRGIDYELEVNKL